MATTPSGLLVKLEELKKWQHNQQERLLQSHYNKIDYINQKPVQFERSKDDSMYNLYMEECIEKPSLTDLNDAPKNMVRKPFLKRGTGLTKYGMKPGDQKRPFNKLKIAKTAVHKRLAQMRKVEKMERERLQMNDTQPTINSRPIFSKKEPPKLLPTVFDTKNNDNIPKPLRKEETQFPISPIAPVSQVKLTPLKKPEVTVQTKGRWYDPGNEYETSHLPESYHSPKQKSPEMKRGMQPISNTVPNDTPNVITPDFLMSLRKLAADKFGPVDETPCRLECPDIDQPDGLNNNKELIQYLQKLADQYSEENEHVVKDLNDSKCGDVAYEKAFDKELRIFEKLEQKVMNSSFSSTNTSILDLLMSSTPSTVNKTRNGSNEKEIHILYKKPTETNAKKALHFEDILETDNSSVTSDDFESKTIHQDWSGGSSDFKCDTSESTSTVSVQKSVPNVIIKQNACVMTDEVQISSNTDEKEEALRNKLRELDAEILNFRRENAILQKMKIDVENERIEIKNDVIKLEKQLLEERIKMEYEMGEEKKKIAKEKAAFERYLKEVQNAKPARKERDMITVLKTELASIQETLKLKETRNGTTQARLRNQIKSLEKENSSLKEELEKLQKQNAKLMANQKIHRKPSDTKMLHEISKNLTKLTQDVKVNKNINKVVKTVEDKSNLDDSLIMLEKQMKHKKKQKNNIKISYPVKSDKEIRKIYNEDSDLDSNQSETNKLVEPHNSEEDDSEDITAQYSNQGSSRHSNENPYKQSDQKESKHMNSYSSSYESFNREKENDKNTTNFDMTNFKNLSDLSLINNYEKVFGKLGARSNSLNDTQGSSSGKVETILEDGSKETKYPNGNVKIKSADGNSIRMNYYNGDIKDTNLLDGTIRYYYLETKMWHTTYPNGNELLEFSDGQVEKHFVDGSSEIIFPNGVKKFTHKEGTEKISYPDGSHVTININGEKILKLPNGQTEIHNKEHKRREYPDGTVKILYPDGLQETRYSNGRIRLKDKDGILLMDSHSNEV